MVSFLSYSPADTSKATFWSQLPIGFPFSFHAVCIQILSDVAQIYQVMFACLLARSIVQALSLETRAHFKYVKHKHRKNECMWRFLHLFSITISVCRFAVVYFPFSMVYVYYHTRWLFRLFECSKIGSHGSAGRFCCDWFHICTFHFHQNNACFVHVFGSR